MKSSRRVLLLLAATLVATAAHAQYGATPIKHVVVIFQENRTPDNFFQGLCTANGDVPGRSASGAGGTYVDRFYLCERRSPDSPINPGWTGHWVLIWITVMVDRAQRDDQRVEFRVQQSGNYRQTVVQRSGRVWG